MSDSAQQTIDRLSGRVGQIELLCSLVLLLVLESFLSPNSFVQRVVFNVLFLGVIVAAIRTLSRSRMRMAAALVMGAVAFGVSCAVEFYKTDAMVAIVYACYIAVFLLLTFALLESVFGEGPVDSHRILGAVNIYFVMGLIWAFVYALLETFQPNSFRMMQSSADGIQQGIISQLMYFSNVTLTTLGYGDVTPLSRPARMFATLEALVGQLYIAIVIARLVGLHASRSGNSTVAD